VNRIGPSKTFLGDGTQHPDEDLEAGLGLRVVEDHAAQLTDLLRQQLPILGLEWADDHRDDVSTAGTDGIGELSPNDLRPERVGAEQRHEQAAASFRITSALAASNRL